MSFPVCQGEPLCKNIFNRIKLKILPYSTSIIPEAHDKLGALAAGFGLLHWRHS